MNKNSSDKEKILANFDINELPSIISDQFTKLGEVETALANANTAVKNAENAVKKKRNVKLFNKKDCIQDLQNVTEDLATAQITTVDAQAQLFEYQKELTIITRFLLALGLYNIAANRTVVREVEMRLKNASEKEISNLAKEELKNVLRQLKAQADVMSKQEKLTETVKVHHGTIKEINKQIDSIETISDEQRILIGAIGAENIAQDKKIDHLIGVVSSHTDELDVRRNKDSEHDEALSKIADKDAEQDEILSDITKKDREQDEKISLGIKKDVEQDTRLLAAEERDKEHDRLLLAQMKADSIHDELFEQQADLNNELISDIKNLDVRSKVLEDSVFEIKNSIANIYEEERSIKNNIDIVTENQKDSLKSAVKEQLVVNNNFSDILKNHSNVQNEMNSRLEACEENENTINNILEIHKKGIEGLHKDVEYCKTFEEMINTLQEKQEKQKSIIKKLTIGLIISGGVSIIALVVAILIFFL